MTTKVTGRLPNEIENFILQRCVINTKRFYWETVVFFAITSGTLFYLGVLNFIDSWLMGLFSILLALVFGIMVWILYAVIKDLTRIKSFKVFSASGEWSMESEGSGRTYHFKSKVNGENICMIVPGMGTLPKIGEKKQVKFEYVNLLDYTPPFGYSRCFVSIEGNEMEQRHADYMNKIKQIGLLSIILSIFFAVFLV